MWLDPHFTQGYRHHLGVDHIVAGDYETAATILRERILLVPETDMSSSLSVSDTRKSRLFRLRNL